MVHCMFAKSRIPLVKDTSIERTHNIFNLSLKGQVLWSLQDYGNTILSLTENNLLYDSKIITADPKVSTI